MKIWVDDVRPAPPGYVWCKSVNSAKRWIDTFEKRVKAYKKRTEGKLAYYPQCELIDVDHDAGEYVSDGGDYIKLLDWLEETGRDYPIKIHSMNPVGVANMRAVIERNGWREIK